MAPPRSPGPASRLDRLRCLPQYALPHHALSRVIHGATRLRWRWWTRALIAWFVRRYRVDLTEAAAPAPAAYPHFNAFFTRALRPGARPLPAAPEAIACPADGTLSAVGDFDHGTLVQAKGQSFTVAELLGDAAPELAAGHYATVYLSPRDYHRVHMPIAGTLRRWAHIPGRLFSVAPYTTRAIPRLFARNERLVCHFDTEAGPVAIVLVGAMLVSGIETVWSGPLKPPRPRTLMRSEDGAGRALARGEELGRFNMGSTVIVVLGAGAARWDPALASGQRLRMGQSLGRWQPPR